MDVTTPSIVSPRHTTPRKQRRGEILPCSLLLKIVARVDVQGLENLPDGPFVGVINHLSSFDTLTGIAVGPIRQATTFAAVEHRSDPIGGWILDQLGVIWVRRGEADREAIKIALDEIKSGTVMAMAIEGTRSRTGGLQPGKTGPAFLASRTHVPMVPAAIWGTEKIISNLKRLAAQRGAPARRPAVPSAGRPRQYRAVGRVHRSSDVEDRGDAAAGVSRGVCANG